MEEPRKPPPSLFVADVQKPEGNSGAGTMDFVFTLSKASSKEVSVKVQSKEVFAKAGEDFTAIDQGITFSPGEVKKNCFSKHCHR